jgi:iron complex outermembrane receptor protein
MKASDLLDQTGVRLSGLWQPNDKLSVRLTGESARNNLGNAAIQGVFLTPGAPGVTPGAQPTVTYKSLGLNPRFWVLDYDGYRLEQAKIVRANVSYDFGPATFTYIGSFNHTQDNHCNSPFGLATFLTHHCSARLQGTTVLPPSENYNETMEHEARLNGETDFGTRWQVGAFFSRFVLHTYVNSFRSSTAFNNETIPANSFHQPHNSENSTAVYGQVTQALNSQLSVTGGLRYSHIYQVAKDNWTDTLNNTLLRTSGGRTIQYNRVFNNDTSKYNKVTWRLGVDYQPTARNLIYGSVSTRFKDGGFTQFNDFAPELITAYEVGTKNRFLDNTLQLNAAAYYYDYSNQQARVFRDFPDGAHLTTVNAGKSTIKGVEVLGVWMPTRNDTLQAGVNYQDGEYTDFPIVVPVIPRNGSSDFSTDLSGNRPPNLSHWILTAGWDHTWARWGDMNLSSSINTRYLSDYFLSVSNLPGDHQNGYMQTDASLKLAGITGHWDLTAWVRNIENNTTLNFAQFVVSTNPIYQFGWNPPRTYGVRLDARF